MTVFAVLKLTGSEFQVEGAATAKALESHFVRKRGTVNIFVLDDLSSLEFWSGTKLLKRYVGWWTRKALKVMVQSLKRMRYFTGSQWKKFKRGLDLLKREALQTTRARQFCTLCNLSMSRSGRLYKRELQ